MAEDGTSDVAQRLVQLLDQLGVARAHFCARAPLDILDLVRAAPDRVASIVLAGATGRPDDFHGLEARILWLLGDEGETGRLMAARLAAQPDFNVHWIKGFSEYGWSDTAAERTDEVSKALLDFLSERDRMAGAPVPVSLSDAGEVAGITYRSAGGGTPVVLLPLGLSAHQWDAVLPHVQASHCTIVLGGRHLQPVENLEARAAGDYSRMALGLLDLAEPGPRDALIEVGCGSGALLRRIARHTGLERIVGLDVNSFLLGEARHLAVQEGLADRLAFHEGSAEAIPFPDNAFDVVFSSTVMEEVDAERMMSELVRIARPGGRVAVAVRSVDYGSKTNLPLPKALKDKLELHSGGVGPRGCADDSLCRRFRDAGLRNVRGGPAWAWIRPEDAWWRNTESQARGLLTAEENDAFTAALAAARAEGLPVWVARPFHCAVGVK